jgi:hypothetical protein
MLEVALERYATLIMHSASAAFNDRRFGAENGTPDFHRHGSGNFGNNGQRNLPVAVRRSFELTNQAIDSN